MKINTLFKLKIKKKLSKLTNKAFYKYFYVILILILAEMMVIPVQTLVSDFVIEINESGADIIKYHQGSR